MAVFQYGYAVLFNVDDADVEAYLDIVRRHASGLLTEMRKDDCAVKEKHLLTEEIKGGPDYIVLKTLDTNSIRIIGSVLGQSIAMCISLYSTLVFFFSSEDLGAVVIKS
ncbi:hypothetical protein HA466_0263030 [Hirschfeldia incana]|nr:hypothetical protein HA466_0263030 [Hirschfeldia incana]